MKYSKKQIDNLMQGIFDGSISVDNLPVDLYEATAKKLTSAFTKIEGTPSKALLGELTENIYLFSGAKTYQQINEITLLGDNGAIKSFGDFKKEALKIYEQYNVRWLEAEYSTTIANAQNCVRWDQIEEQKETLPYLTYSAIIDPNTSVICAPLDGITLPVGHPFWSKNAPVNHFNCRCTFIQKDKFDASVSSKTLVDKVEKQMALTKQPYFNNNPGKDKEIFNKNHPYFDVPVKDEKLAKNNFNLPLPDGQ